MSTDDDMCWPASVTVDNQANPKFTKLTIEGKDYPGLLRVLCWTLNALGVRVHSAKLTVQEDKASRGCSLNPLQLSPINCLCRAI